MSLNDEQLDNIFSDFLLSGNGQDDSIRQLYEVLPYLSADQQRVLTIYRTLAVKYNSPVLHEMAQSIHDMAEKNRPLGFRFTRLIESFSLYKHFKGYQATSRMDNTKDNM